MEATGSFDYKLDFAYNKNKPKSTGFDSKLKRKSTNHKVWRGELEQTQWRICLPRTDQKCIPAPCFSWISQSNYTPLDQISPYLRKSVLTTEDPSFFSHRGFITEAFKQSIVKNIRTKKFAQAQVPSAQSEECF
jgi:hypothetical protein